MKRFQIVFVVFALVVFAMSASAFSVTNAPNVLNALAAANAVSAPFNPYAGLIAALLQILGPIAGFLAGAFAHRSGVESQQKGVL